MRFSFTNAAAASTLLLASTTANAATFYPENDINYFERGPALFQSYILNDGSILSNTSEACGYGYKLRVG